MEIKIIDGSLIQIGPWQMEVINNKLIITNADKAVQNALAEFPFEIYSRGEVKKLHARTIKLPL